MRQRIGVCLWFDGQAEQAAEFYTSIFENSKIHSVSRYGEAGPGEAGSVMVVNFEIDGSKFMGLNGGPMFTFNEAVSITVDCENQAEVDRYWDALLADGGQESQCGWLKDKFGVSWQITPVDMEKYVGGPDPEGSRRAMEAMMRMRKIDLPTIEAAYRG